MGKGYIIRFTALLCALAICLSGKASPNEESTVSNKPLHLYDNVTNEDWSIDTAHVKELRLNVNSTLFFRDNEFSTPLVNGYTLPGFRLCPNVEYTPSKYVQVQLGVYMMKFWGAKSYPNAAYSDLPYWTGNDNAVTGLHVVPYFRVQMATKWGLNIILGSIYGARYHNLIEPLYAPELNFTADPETGVQFLYSNKWLNFDAWINWQSFIYKLDNHQEAFTFGVSAKFKYNSTESRIHVYSPLQAIFHHRGGEIDTISTNRVQTLINTAAGVGARIAINKRSVRSLAIEANGMLYNQESGHLWPFQNGWAVHANAILDLSFMRIRTGYFYGNEFISLFGYPFFGNFSQSTPGLTFPRTSMAYVGLNFNYTFHPGYTLGVNAEMYQHFAATGYINDVARRYDPSTSFAASIYFYLNPSFLLKSFKK